MFGKTVFFGKCLEQFVKKSKLKLSSTISNLKGKILLNLNMIKLINPQKSFLQKHFKKIQLLV